jgi:hypothetical protein
VGSAFGGNVRPSAAPKTPPVDPAAAGGDPNAMQQQQGDGFHPHTLDQDESGFHSTHTMPDGQTEDSDFPDYESAMDAMNQSFGQDGASGDSEDDMPAEPAADDSQGAMPNLSERYSKGK